MGYIKKLNKIPKSEIRNPKSEIKIPLLFLFSKEKQ